MYHEKNAPARAMATFVFKMRQRSTNNEIIESKRFVKAYGYLHAVKVFESDFIDFGEPIPDYALMDISLDPNFLNHRKDFGGTKNV